MATLMPGGKQTYFDNAGDPLAGGLLYTYAAGTSTPLATYSDKAGTTPNTNPVVLDARGEATVFWGAASYKVSLHTAADATIWTQDDVDPSALLSGYAPLASPAFTGTPTGLGPSPITATGSTTARSLAARFADVVNVKDLGAVADGVTDNSAAFAAAVTLAAGLRDVLVPGPGTYLVKNASVDVANTAIRGTNGATLKLPVLAALDGSPILNVTVSGVATRGIIFDGDKASQPADGFSDSFSGGLNGQGRAYRAAIKATGASELVGLTVEDCTFLNMYGAGIAARDVSHVKVRRNKASGNNFETLWVSSTYSWGTFLFGHEVTGNEIVSTGSGHASVNGNAILLTMSDGAVVSDNIIQTVERNGVKMESPRNAVISHNTIGGVSVANFGGIQVQGRAQNLTIAGNVISDAGAGITLNSVPTTELWTGINIFGNAIYSLSGPTTGDGVALNPAVWQTVSIANNTVDEFQRYAVSVRGASSGLSISGNTMLSTTSTSGGVFLNAETGDFVQTTVVGNALDMTGASAVNEGGLSLRRSAAFVFTGLNVGGNTLAVGASRQAITDHSVASVTSGALSGNVLAGSLALLTSPPLADVSADRGDADVTLTVGEDARTQRFATALTANRTVTLSTTGVFPGATWRIVRTGLGAFTLNVGGLKTIPNTTAAFVDVAYSGSAWVLTGYGTL